MPAPFTDNAEKKIVRIQWDTPILRHLHESYKVKFRYLGLPGVELIDVGLWRDMIEEVIAFETRDGSATGRDAIDALRRNMRVKGIPGYAYFGPFEEVVVLKKDYDGTAYSQSKVVTLYNLDFCDEISSAITTRERMQKIWRFEAIRHVLRDQGIIAERQQSPPWFVLMLTIRNQIGSRKIAEFLGDNLFADARDFLSVCNGLAPIPRASKALIGSHAWALKCFVYNSLRTYFSNPHISACFFPPVLYNGTPIRVSNSETVPSPMLHWVILCHFSDRERPSPQFFPPQYLSRASIGVENGKELRWSPQTGETVSSDGSPDVVKWFGEMGGSVWEALERSRVTSAVAPGIQTVAMKARR